MPRGDRTGPMGCGPMTGRGAGHCAGYPVPGFMNPMNPTGGRGLGFGRGRGWHRGYYAAGMSGWAHYGYGYGPGWVAPAYPPVGGPVPFAQGPVAEGETEYLKDHADFLRKQLEEINERLRDLENDKGAGEGDKK